MSYRADSLLTFHYPREEMEYLAGAVDTTTRMLYAPRIRQGDTAEDRKLITEGTNSLRDLCTAILEEIEVQDREPQPDEITVNRVTMRFLLYGVLHCLDQIAAGRDSIMGEGPYETLAAITGGCWELVGAEEREQREAIMHRQVSRYHIEKNVSAQIATALPDDWLTDEPPPFE